MWKRHCVLDLSCHFYLCFSVGGFHFPFPTYFGRSHFCLLCCVCSWCDDYIRTLKQAILVSTLNMLWCEKGLSHVTFYILPRTLCCVLKRSIFSCWFFSFSPQNPCWPIQDIPSFPLASSLQPVHVTWPYSHPTHIETEDGVCQFLWNVCIHIQHNTVSHLRKPQS